MEKIKDRLMLGMISGLAGNLTKWAITMPAVKLGLAEFAGPTRAASILLPKNQVNKPLGLVVGVIADSFIASTIGVCLTYILSLTGKDNAILKGSFIGTSAWNGLYGVLANMGATRIFPKYPKTVLTEYIAHVGYGVTVALVATKLGDERLFNGGIPITVKAKGQQKEPVVLPKSTI